MDLETNEGYTGGVESFRTALDRPTRRAISSMTDDKMLLNLLVNNDKESLGFYAENPVAFRDAMHKFYSKFVKVEPLQDTNNLNEDVVLQGVELFDKLFLGQFAKFLEEMESVRLAEEAEREGEVYFLFLLIYLINWDID